MGSFQLRSLCCFRVNYRHYVTRCNKTSPLQGIKVIDMTRVVAGPMCTMLLGDLGADIFKIEEISSGDVLRQLPPFIKDTDVGCQFISVNRNKKSVCVNIKTAEGQDIIKRLAQRCDILVENFIPGVLYKYGLSYEQLKLQAPHLIYCSITGFGHEGPYSKKPGVDLIAASVGGFLHVTGPEGGEPCKAGVAVTDMMTGMYAHGAILAALLNRAKRGLGDHIKCDLFSTQVTSLTNLAMSYLNAGIEPKKLGTAHGGVVPYEAFKTKDGYLTMGTIDDKQFVEFCNVINFPELYTDARFSTNNDRVKNKAELLPILRNVLLEKTTAEWCNLFEGHSFVFGPLNTLEQVFNDPHVKATNMVENIEHPVAGLIKLLAPAVKFDNIANDIRLPPPMLGQHTAEVLRDVLNFSEDVIEDLRFKNIIR